MTGSLHITKMSHKSRTPSNDLAMGMENYKILVYTGCTDNSEDVLYACITYNTCIYIIHQIVMMSYMVKNSLTLIICKSILLTLNAKGFYFGCCFQSHSP